MKRILFVMIFLAAFAGIGRAQNACTVTRWQQPQEPITQIVVSQDLAISCPSLLTGYNSRLWIHGIRATFTLPDGTTVNGTVFQVEPLRDRIGVRVPIEAVGATRVTVFVMGRGTFTIDFSPPVVSALPRVFGEGVIGILTNTSHNPVINGGVINLPRVTFLLTLQAEDVGQGGQFLFTFRKADGSLVQRIGRIFPRSSGLTVPLAQVEVYQLDLDGAVGLRVCILTDPNACSEETPLVVNVPSAI